MQIQRQHLPFIAQIRGDNPFSSFLDSISAFLDNNNSMTPTCPSNEATDRGHRPRLSHGSFIKPQESVLSEVVFLDPPTGGGPKRLFKKSSTIE